MGNIIYVLLLLPVSFFTCWCASKYKIFLEPKSWSEAQSFCRRECVDLVTVHDMKEMKFLLEMFQSHYEDALWIGLQQGKSTNYHWSLADERFYKDGERTSFNISQSSSYNCVYFNNELLYTGFCKIKRQAMCFDESKQGREQYVLTPTQFFWMGAREFCRTHHTDLVSVRNAAESQTISEVSGGAKVWIGLFKDLLVWSDNDYSSFRYFPATVSSWTGGSTACVAMTKNEFGRWERRPCDQPLPFICHCPRFLMTVKVTLTSAAGLDTLDAVGRQNLIGQVEQILDQAALYDHPSLKWIKKSNGNIFVKKKKEA